MSHTVRQTEVPGKCFNVLLINQNRLKGTVLANKTKQTLQVYNKNSNIGNRLFTVSFIICAENIKFVYLFIS